MIDYKISEIKILRSIVNIFVNFSKCTWVLPPKNKNPLTITNKFLKILTTWKRCPVKLENDRVREFYNSFFSKLLTS